MSRDLLSEGSNENAAAGLPSIGSTNNVVLPQEVQDDDTKFRDIWNFMKRPDDRLDINLTKLQLISNKKDLRSGDILYICHPSDSSIHQKVVLVVARPLTNLCCLSLCRYRRSRPDYHWLVEEDVDREPNPENQQPETVFVKLTPYLTNFEGQVSIQPHIMIDIETEWTIENSIQVYELGRVTNLPSLHALAQARVARHTHNIQSSLPPLANPEHVAEHPQQQALRNAELEASTRKSHKRHGSQDTRSSDAWTREPIRKDKKEKRRHGGWGLF